MDSNEIFSRADKENHYEGSAQIEYGVRQLKRQLTGMCGVTTSRFKGDAAARIRWAGLAETDEQAKDALEVLVDGEYKFDDKILKIEKVKDRGMTKYRSSVRKAA